MNKPMADKWSGKEVIGHTIRNAQINLQRFVAVHMDRILSLVKYG
jgi:hypothetical protein